MSAQVHLWASDRRYGGPIRWDISVALGGAPARRKSHHLLVITAVVVRHPGTAPSLRTREIYPVRPNSVRGTDARAF